LQVQQSKTKQADNTSQRHSTFTKAANACGNLLSAAAANSGHSDITSRTLLASITCIASAAALDTTPPPPADVGFKSQSMASLAHPWRARHTHACTAMHELVTTDPPCVAAPAAASCSADCECTSASPQALAVPATHNGAESTQQKPNSTSLLQQSTMESHACSSHMTRMHST